jgi:ribosomal protein S2
LLCLFHRGLPRLLSNEIRVGSFFNSVSPEKISFVRIKKEQRVHLITPNTADAILGNALKYLNRISNQEMGRILLLPSRWRNLDFIRRLCQGQSK